MKERELVFKDTAAANLALALLGISAAAQHPSGTSRSK
jgi:hypothetical protein